MTNNVALTANDVSFTNTFTPAHQWNSSNISNAAYKYAPPTSGTDVYTPDASGLNQYGTITPAGGSAQTIGYDTRGNLTSDGVLTLTYDPENRLMAASKSGMTASYMYDPGGRRTTKTVNGTVTNFLHDGDTEIAEYNGTGALVRRFVPGPAIDHPIAMVTAAGVKTMFHVDKLGSVVAMSNATNGQLPANGGPFAYDAYGNCITGGSACSGAATPYLYTGQRFDPETGLYYYRARYYSAVLGRFLQTDPVGYNDGQNWYLYTHADPTNGSDPSGLSCNSDKSGAVATCKFDNISGEGNANEQTQANTYLASWKTAVSALQKLDPKAVLHVTVNGKTMSITAGQAAKNMIDRKLVMNYNPKVIIGASGQKLNAGAQTETVGGIVTTTITPAAIAGAPVRGVLPAIQVSGMPDMAATLQRYQMVQAVHDGAFHGSDEEAAAFGNAQQRFANDPKWNEDHQTGYNEGAANALGIPYVSQH